MGGNKQNVGKRIQRTVNVQKKKTPHCHMKGKPIERTYSKVILMRIWHMLLLCLQDLYFS